MKENLGQLIINGRGEIKDIKPSVRITKPQFIGQKQFTDYLNDMQEIQGRRAENNPWKEEIDINIDCQSEWFGIRPLSDLHIGAEGVDYEKVKEVLGTLKDHDNLQTILLGDIGDFFIPACKYKDGALGEVANPNDQFNAIGKFFQEYKDKILAMSNDPSHTNWIDQATGIDSYAQMSKGTGIPLVNQGGRIGIHLNGIEYNLVPFHNIGRFKSSFNLTHAGKRVFELHRDGDVVMSGHIHHSAFEIARRNGHEVGIIQCGTTKTSDAWGAKMGFLGRPDSGYPVLLLNTKRKDLVIVKNLEEASLFL